LSPEEKTWAKIGTAEVGRENCLAWGENRRCVVCQEVCPFGAIDLAPPPPDRSVPVPVVATERCFGCGYCEHHCPAAEPAVVVRAAGALRLGPAAGSYRAEAEARGLDLALNRRDAGEDESELPEGQLPPGFLE
jgi:ferredoxin